MTNLPTKDHPDTKNILITFGVDGPDVESQAMMDDMRQHFLAMTPYTYRGKQYIILSFEFVVGDRFEARYRLVPEAQVAK